MEDAVLRPAIELRPGDILINEDWTSAEPRPVGKVVRVQVRGELIRIGVLAGEQLTVWQHRVDTLVWSLNLSPYTDVPLEWLETFIQAESQ